MDINIDIDVIKYLINNYTNNELGVRNIKRCIEDLFLKINLLRLTKGTHNKNILDIDYNIENLSFPLNISIKIIDNLLKLKNKINSFDKNMMYC
jgi:ATP-dependent Lon protease